MKKDTPVLGYLQLAWDNACKKSHSWRILNSALSQSLNLAITHGFPFAEGDFHAIYKRFNFGFWGGDTPAGLAEGFYSLAAGGPRWGSTGLSNLSAALSFEAWKNRRPWIFQGTRLALGSEVWWWEKWPKVPADLDPDRWIGRHHKATRLWVTNLDEEHLSLCWYRNPGNHQTGKPARRVVLQRDDLAAANRQLAQFRKAYAERKAQAESAIANRQSAI